MKSKHCQWCDNTFASVISYQVYCSVECREAATKEKIAARYVQTRTNRRIGKTRLCKNCNANLSIYNDDPVCARCTINPKDLGIAIKDLKGLANGKDSQAVKKED
jgi:non-homologous end joining protein Ku